MDFEELVVILIGRNIIEPLHSSLKMREWVCGEMVVA